MPISVGGLQNMAGGSQLPLDVGFAIEVKDADVCQKALDAWIEALLSRSRGTRSAAALANRA